MLPRRLKLPKAFSLNSPLRPKQGRRNRQSREPFPEIELGAIFQRSSGAKAQVNGRILGVGDTIEDARIIAIHRISIAVEHHDRIRTFTLD
ncbi:hypothetical protein IEN85_05225 [Pelagicoccus sp. NFK12]|uniref:Uncharacterized protein n=1 Tax=Pelagicoccus enzymogenes TaxID=2773457 RepID=A0A927F5Q5_9BACT|nr:hypothetical protein [Pelagicoccus enzymogenes]MBD5778884.1 hypothetical protein [Pelagicoccus enzymogenes]